MAYGCGHSTYLSIPSFSQRDGNPGGGYIFPEADRRNTGRKFGFSWHQSDLSRFGLFPLNHDARLQSSEVSLGYYTFNLNNIRTGVFESWIGEPVVQCIVVSQKEQALAIEIQSPN